MRPRLLSQCIRRGSDLLPGRSPGRYVDVLHEGSCPLGAAFVGGLHGPADVQKFYTLVANSSDESIAEFILVGLHKAHPIVGCTVRVNDKLAQYLERERLLPRRPAETATYSLDAHVSVFAAITRLHDKEAWHKDQVAGLLARCGL